MDGFDCGTRNCTCYVLVMPLLPNCLHLEGYVMLCTMNASMKDHIASVQECYV
jgi:hypothetical protein